jgi:ADP-ribose pyrophosphatase YjhB (NUDIX family)
MRLKNLHCSYCGEIFPDKLPWPRECSACGSRSYLNPIPVVVAIVPMENGLVVVRRNIEPRKGTLTLPGGYLDSGETWQEGTQRELLEETGIRVSVEDISLYDVANGIDDTLVILGLAVPQPITSLVPFSSVETQEVLLIDRPIELGFPLHTQIVQRYFAGVRDVAERIKLKE